MRAFGWSCNSARRSGRVAICWRSPPSAVLLELLKAAKLRYGENPHQLAALYDFGETTGIAKAEILSGKEMSFNNYVDADAAWQLVSDFDETACAIVKHTNPAGVGLAATPAEAYRKALATDPISAFGGIVAFNRAVDEAAAKAVVEVFTEVVIAPDYHANALEVLRTKKNLRVLRAGAPGTLGPTMIVIPVTQQVQRDYRAPSAAVLVGYHTPRRHHVAVGYLGGLMLLEERQHTTQTFVRVSREATTFTYRAAAAMGFGVDIALGSHLALVPQIRADVFVGGLSVQPAVGVRWNF